MRKPARILVVVDALVLGGAERIAVETACGLDRSRFDPHILVTRFSGPLEERLRAAEVPFTILDRRLRPSPTAYARARDLTLLSDLVHTHKFGSNVWGALLARTAGVPLIVHEHNWSGIASRA